MEEEENQVKVTPPASGYEHANLLVVLSQYFSNGQLHPKIDNVGRY